MHSILRDITISISHSKCMFYFLLDSQHLFLFVSRYFTRTHVVHEVLLHLSSKLDFLTYNTFHWGHHLASILIPVCVNFCHEIPFCTHVFYDPLWIFPHSIIIISVCLLVALLFSLVP